jgi:hypothetical protein
MVGPLINKPTFWFVAGVEMVIATTAAHVEAAL